MTLEAVTLKNYRNICGEEIKLSQKLNIIYGDNAQGKTNILEAIYFFARGKSFRTKNEAELIRFGCEEADIKISFSDLSRNQSSQIHFIRKSKKKMLLNGYEIKRTSELIGNFRAVLFCPEHLEIIKSSPKNRRSFVDVALSQIKPAYVDISKKYYAVLENRNALLKAIKDDYFSKKSNTDEYKNKLITLEVLTEQLSLFASKITEYRIKYIEQLDIFVNNYFQKMTDGREKIQFIYQSSVNYSCAQNDIKNNFENLYKSNIEREIKQGLTLYGIHKDDIDILIFNSEIADDYISAKSYASQGQQRSLALAMKLAEGDIVRAYTDEFPVFLFDDVLSELDESRQQFLLSNLIDRQVIITSCKTDNFTSSQIKNTIHIQNGRVLK